MNRRVNSFVMALLTTMALANVAQADLCEDASIRGQKAAKQAKLLEARAALKECLQSSCPPSTRDDCSGFLADVNTRMPTVVLVATIGGAPAVAVSVTVDGTPVATKLDGIAIEMNPGLHTFEFKAADGRVEKTEQGIIESKKAQEVRVSFPAPKSAEPPPAATTEPAPAPIAPPPAEGTSPVRYVGLAVAGVGAVVGIAGVVVGFGGASKYNDANDKCGSLPIGAAECQPSGPLGQEKADGLSQKTLGIVLGGLGAAALVTGVVLVIAAPSSKSTAQSGITHFALSPTGFSLVGRF